MAGLDGEIFRNTEFQPLLWLHYLDDFFCLWTDTIEKLKEFLEFLNAFHPSIKLLWVIHYIRLIVWKF